MSEYLMHYGVKGSKWGIRRYQNEDGSLTAEGREHYGVGEGGVRGNSMARPMGAGRGNQRPGSGSKWKTAAKIAGGVAAAAAIAVGAHYGYKYRDVIGKFAGTAANVVGNKATEYGKRVADAMNSGISSAKNFTLNATNTVRNGVQSGVNSAMNYAKGVTNDASKWLTNEYNRVKSTYGKGGRILNNMKKSNGNTLVMRPSLSSKSSGHSILDTSTGKLVDYVGPSATPRSNRYLETRKVTDSLLNSVRGDVGRYNQQLALQDEIRRFQQKLK